MDILRDHKQERIKNDRRHPGVIVEVKKSTAVDVILCMIKLKVISKDDLNDFSSELKQEIERRIAFYRQTNNKSKKVYKYNTILKIYKDDR